MLRLRTQSFRRYRIHGTVPSPHSDAFQKAVHERRFRALTANEERAYGWVSAENLLLTEFDEGPVMCGEYVALALRIDRRRVNARLLRAQMDLELRGRRKEAEAAGKKFRLPREERRSLREGLHKELLRLTNPTIDAYTILVHTKKRVAHVLSLARSANELACLHFQDTFDAELEPITPWTLGQELLTSSSLRESFQDLRRSDFVNSTEHAAPPEFVARGLTSSSASVSTVREELHS